MPNSHDEDVWVSHLSFRATLKKGGHFFRAEPESAVAKLEKMVVFQSDRDDMTGDTPDVSVYPSSVLE